MKAKKIEYELGSRLESIGRVTLENPYGEGIQYSVECKVTWEDGTYSVGSEDTNSDQLDQVKQSQMNKAFKKAKVAKMLLQDKKVEPDPRNITAAMIGGMTPDQFLLQTKMMEAQADLDKAKAMFEPRTFTNYKLNDPYAASRIMAGGSIE